MPLKRTPRAERWYGPDASATDVLRRCVRHDDQLVQHRRKWNIERPHGDGIFARRVPAKVIAELREKKYIDEAGGLTYKGKKEGLRLAKLYVMGKI